MNCYIPDFLEDYMLILCISLGPSVSYILVYLEEFWSEVCYFYWYHSNGIKLELLESFDKTQICILYVYYLGVMHRNGKFSKRSIYSICYDLNDLIWQDWKYAHQKKGNLYNWINAGKSIFEVLIYEF